MNFLELLIYAEFCLFGFAATIRSSIRKNILSISVSLGHIIVKIIESKHSLSLYHDSFFIASLYSP